MDNPGLAKLLHEALYRRGARNYRKRVGETRLNRPGTRQWQWDRLHSQMSMDAGRQVTRIEAHLWKSAGPSDIPSSFAFYLSSIYDRRKELFLSHALESTRLRVEDLILLDPRQRSAQEGFRRGIHRWCAQVQGVPALVQACLGSGLPGLVVRIAKFLASTPDPQEPDPIKRLVKNADVAAFYEDRGFPEDLRAECDAQIGKRIRTYFNVTRQFSQDPWPWYESVMLRIRLHRTPERVQRALQDCDGARSMLQAYYEERGEAEAAALASRAVLPADVSFRTLLARTLLQHRLDLGAPVEHKSAHYHRLMRLNRQLLKMIAPYLERVSWEREQDSRSEDGDDSRTDDGHEPREGR